MREAARPDDAPRQWEMFARAVHETYAEFFAGAGKVVGARAPGRLDLLGGISDYAGGTVLEATLAEATCAAVQGRADRLLVLRSVGAADETPREMVTLSLDTLLDEGSVRPFPEVTAAFRELGANRWTGYVAGCLYVLMAAGWLEPAQATGLNILVTSSVPTGAGVSSSAALEVAVMSALLAHYGIQMDGQETARLCQMVENRVVGAPCGIMDQMTSALGQENSLLVLKCQPAELLGYQTLPPGWRVVGLDSGVKHSVGGRQYTKARVGAFMGLHLLQAISGKTWGGYLCNVTPDEWAHWRDRLPETLTGADYFAQHDSYPDTVTTIDPAETYRVRSCTEHPILENNRVREFLALMNFAAGTNEPEPDAQILREAGQLLLDSHMSYSDRVELGAAETDLLVGLAMQEGPKRGIYGAKITGGGSGGTVALLCAGAEVDSALQRIRRAYEKQTGLVPRLMTESSPGAVAFGTHSL